VPDDCVPSHVGISGVSHGVSSPLKRGRGYVCVLLQELGVVSEGRRGGGEKVFPCVGTRKAHEA